MKMTYFVLGTNDMPRAIAFYDAFFEDSGMKKIYSEGRMTLWKGDDFMFAVAEPYDGQPATQGNGTMVGFELGSAAEVEKSCMQRPWPWAARTRASPACARAVSPPTCGTSTATSSVCLNDRG